MANLHIKCPKCGGKVMEDIESAKYMDLHCIFCAKRWHIPKYKYRKFLQKKTREYEAKRASSRKPLAA